MVAERAGIGRESAVELATGRVYLIDTPEHTRPSRYPHDQGGVDRIRSALFVAIAALSNL